MKRPLPLSPNPERVAVSPDGLAVPMRGDRALDTRSRSDRESPAHLDILEQPYVREWYGSLEALYRERATHVPEVLPFVHKPGRR